MSTPCESVTPNDQFQGSLNSHVILIEWGDYQCSVCKMTLPIIKQLQKEIGENLCYVFRHFPLKNPHPLAFDAAIAAEAAGLQNKFWQMHELLYARQLELNPKIWIKLAEELNLNIEKFKTDFESNDLKEKIQDEFMAGIHSGVNQIPCFYINGNRFDGDASFSNLKETLIQAASKGH
jgi:protein-disulfide isomerase